MGQNIETGEMHQIDRATFDDLRAQVERAAAMKRVEELSAQLLPKVDMVTPAGSLVHLSGALCEGERVEVRGCHFRVAEIGRRFVILEGVPAIGNDK